MTRLAILLLLFGGGAWSQSGQAELFGTIRDRAGLPVPECVITAENQSTTARFRVVSGDRGAYRLLGLPVGEYALMAQRTGFRPFRQSGITLRAGDQRSLDIALEVGGPETQAIEVKGDAPLLETATGQVSYSVDRTKMASMPLDGRNFVPLIALSPGVALPGGGSLLPRINGSRPRTNEYLYDGIGVLQPEPGQVAFYPVLDAVQEFRLNINSYSAEYGRSNGGTVMVTTRSGGNTPHGTLFEYFRNEQLNARNYFAPAGPKPEFRRNQYGGTLGAPIQRNRTFFFVDWQGTRLRTGVTRFSTVPTAAQREGVFPSTILDPTAQRQPFPGNTIPAERFDAIARQVIDRYPLPNLPGAANNFVRTASEPDGQDQFDVRIDRYFGARHRVFGRYSYMRDDDTPVTPLPEGSGAIASGVTGHALTRADGLVAEYDWSPRPAWLNSARFGYTRRDLNQTSLQNGGISIPGTPANSFAAALPQFAVAGYQQIGPVAGANDRFTTSVTEFVDAAAVARSRHTIKFGVDLRREALDVLNPPNPAGAYSFNAAATGNAFAALLLGQVNAFSIDIQSATLQPRAHFAEFFVTDAWNATSRLTINVGTRYTLNFPSTEAHDRGAIFNLKTQVLDFPHTARELECCDFGPRVGVAYRAGDTWSIRAGYGMIWFEQTGITTPFTLPQFPFIQTVGLQSPDNLAPAFLLANGPTVQVTPPNPNSGLGQGVFGVDRRSGSGYSQQWNFTVQKTIGRDLNFEAGYLGSKNTRLGVPDANINQLPAADLSLGAALAARVPNPYFGEIPASSSLGGPTITAQQLLRPYPRFTAVALFRDNVGNSSYHALQAKLEKRFSRGLTFTLAYTLSKLMDDASSVFSSAVFTGPIANTGVADAYNRHLEKDLSNGDIPRVFSVGWVYELPHGFRIAGVVRVQSGDTVAVSQATNFNASFGFGVQRPNRIADPNQFAGRSVAQWFNTAAFAPAPQFTIGNSSRNPIRGPGLQNADLMVAKTFRVSERTGLEIRGEVFNVSNTPPLNDPNASFGSAAFGSITSAGNPRVFELAARLSF
jgi:hypothetical protein